MCLLKVFVTVILFITKPEINIAQNDQNPIVVTKSGPVMGRTDYTVGQNKTYYAFQGIPYAEPPLGDLRFSAPVKKSNWSDVLNATEDKSECVQNSNPVSGSEDCLFINVYTPSLTASNLSVIVFIYGGAFVGGNSSYESNGPDYLLDKDIVFVCFNYRVGIFGFISTEDEECSGNWGLKDQLLAFQWVQENVAYFGGNPDNVTLLGESAGAVSISYQLQTNKTKGLFNAAIMQSGTSLNLWGLNRRAKQTAFAVGAALGIVTTDSSVLIECLREVNYTDLQSASVTVSTLITLENPLQGIYYGPVIEPEYDGAIFVSKSKELLSQGGLQKVPTIMGFNSNEAAAVGTIPDIFRIYLLYYDVSPDELTPIDLTTDTVDRLDVGEEIKERYFGLLPIALSSDSVIQFVSDDQFNRPIRQTVIEQSKYAPVYCYMFSYEGTLGGIVNRNFSGVGHAEDLGYIFRRNFTNVPESDILTRSRIITMWTNFIKHGNPTPTADPLLQNVTWETAGSNSSNLNYLDIDVDLELLQNPFEESMEFYDGLYSEFESAASNDTY